MAENVKTTRPDLSFITSQSFESMEDYTAWFCRLTKEQADLVNHLQLLKFPNLITCAEMLFDANVGNPKSIVFEIVSGTLNEK